MSESEFIEWSANHFRMMAEGGVWGVPRSGLIFRKQDGELILSDRMPHDPVMPVDAEELRMIQNADYEAIKYHFEAAGIAVRSEIE